jgi:hypothetical protein
MSRSITLLFRRDPTCDRQTESVHFAGYRPCWPNGQPVAIGMDAFCKHGQRLLGLGKQLAGRQEALVRLICMPLQGRDDDINRIPGHRVRRFYVERAGQTGRLHFLDGTPTTVLFELGQDEPLVLKWIGEIQWVDLAATTVDAATPARPRYAALPG